MRQKGFFTCFSQKIACGMGSPWAFFIAFIIVILWAVSGPMFGYSNTWQLVINTSTTIVTFLMVFLIQNTQNRDTKAMQLKLDELIRATDGAHTILLDLEELNEDELNKIRNQYEKIAQEARSRVRGGGKDTNMPEVILESE